MITHNLKHRQHNIKAQAIKAASLGSATPLLILRSGRTICRERRVKDNEGDGASEILNNPRAGCAGGEPAG